MKQEMDDLSFENCTVRKDYNAATEALRETQERLHAKMAEEEQRMEKEQRDMQVM